MQSRRVSIAKALTWRAIALSVTSSVAYFISHDAAVAASIGLADSLIKIFAYYLHERAWMRVGEAPPPHGTVGHATRGPTTE